MSAPRASHGGGRSSGPTRLGLVLLASLLAGLDAPAQETAASGEPRRPSVHLALLAPAAGAAPDPSARRALATLGATVARRTSVEIGVSLPPVLGPLDAELFEHPLVFLSGEGELAAWSDTEVDAMRTYLALGGMVVLDDRSGRKDSPFARSAAVQFGRVLGGRRFEPLPTGQHAIFRAYYLLERAWGRTDASEELLAIQLDGRAAVVLCADDLLGALARDEFGQWSQPVEPGGRRQREQALRLGVNLVLYALTLDYKEDLVHLPHILERRR